MDVGGREGDKKVFFFSAPSSFFFAWVQACLAISSVFSPSDVSFSVQPNKLFYLLVQRMFMNVSDNLEAQ